MNERFCVRVFDMLRSGELRKREEGGRKGSSIRMNYFIKFIN